MSSFNIADVLAKAGVNVDTDSKMQIQMVSIDMIVPDENNFYELSELEELAASIAMCGLQQPLLVRPMEGDESQVIITSGHRRHAALKMLIEQDGREDLRDVPCIVAPAGENPKLTQLKLIMANSTARKLSSADTAKQAEQIESLLYELKEDGFDFPGRMRDHVAEACKVSAGKLARLKMIRSGLIPQLMRLWEIGKIADNAAELLAKQTPRVQKAIFEAQTEHMQKSFSCDASWISTLVREIDRVETTCSKTACTKNCTSKCDHVYVRSNHAAGLQRYTSMPCNGCCCSCYWLTSCKFSCEWAADEKKAKKAEAHQKKAAEAEAEAERKKPEADLIKAAYARIADLRKKHSMAAEDFIKQSKDYCYSGDADRLKKLEDGANPSGSDRMPGGIWPSEAMRIIRLADKLGCSIDYLLGRPEPEKKAPAVEWMTGNPKEPGYYICRFTLPPETDPMYSEFWWGGQKWTRLTGMEEITHWMPAPEVD